MINIVILIRIGFRQIPFLAARRVTLEFSLRNQVWHCWCLEYLNTAFRCIG